MARKNQDKAVRQAAERAASAAEEEAENSAEKPHDDATDQGVVDVSAATPAPTPPGNSIVIVTQPHPAT